MSSSGVPEPIPNWNTVRGQEVWKWALPIHSYIFGVTFFAVAIYGIHILVKLRKLWMTKARNYFICITGLVCILGLTRAIVLLADPYATGKPSNLKPGVGLMLFSLGYPCLTSGFFLINWSLVEVTKLQLIPPRIHKRKVLALVLVIHFTVVITLDSLFVRFPQMMQLLMICRSFFVIWGILLFGGFIIAGIRIQRQVKHNFKTIFHGESTLRRNPSINNNSTENTASSVTIATTDVTSRLGHVRTRKVMTVARRAAATGLLICCTQIYSLWEFWAFYNDNVKPDAWPWWAYQTCFRCIELFMVAQMFQIVRPKH